MNKHDTIEDHDDQYNSEEDSDFNPEETVRDEGDSSDSDSQPTGGSRKRKRRQSLDEAAGGGLVKTRSQRATETRTTPTAVVGDPTATTDVDRLWEQMNAAPVIPSSREMVEGVVEEGGSTEGGEKMVAIKSTYEFAGQTIAISEEKLVLASSFTAKAHLSQQGISGDDKPSAATSEDPSHPPRRRVPKKRASAFDTAAAARSKPAPPNKLNTLEKSRLDWAGFVDREGIGDDLQKWNKGDKGYLERQAFLGRVDENKERQRKLKKEGVKI